MPRSVPTDEDLGPGIYKQPRGTYHVNVKVANKLVSKSYKTLVEAKAARDALKAQQQQLAAEKKKAKEAVTDADKLKAWEEKHGHKGLLSHGSRIRRQCACGRPTRAVDEEKCPSCGGKGPVHGTCQVEGCSRVANHGTGLTLCASCWVKEDPETRGCPTCKKWPAAPSHPDRQCHFCAKAQETEAKREAGQALLPQFCAGEGVPEAPERAADADFGVRYGKLNEKNGYAPCVMVRIPAGNSEPRWRRGCTTPGCVRPCKGAPGTPGTQCVPCGGGKRCPGTPDLTECPYNHQIGNSDDCAHYIKDGIEYCRLCYCKRWPDDELSKNAKKYMHAKEQAVREFLEQRFAESHPALKWVMDRRVDGTSRRPDHRPLIHLLGVKSHDLVIETDENSHWFYLCADEREKEADVHRWLNGKKKPLFFVRINPDAYDSVTGERVTSCWGKGPLGLPRVKPSKEAEWAMRLEKLAQVIEMYLVDYTDTWAAWAEADRPKPELHAIELFYDDVLMKKNAATQAFDAIKAASKKRKAAAMA